MAGFSSYQDVINNISSGNWRNTSWLRSTISPEVAGTMFTLWEAAGGGPVSPFSPGIQYTGYPMNSGAIWSDNLDRSPLQKHLLGLEATCTAGTNVLMVYDRLVSVAFQLTGTGPASLTINSAALPRYTDGIGVQAWIEVSTATTTTAPALLVSGYTNHEGTANRVSPFLLSFPAVATNKGYAVPVPLQAGDRGVRSVQNIQLVTGAAVGTGNLVLIQPLFWINTVSATTAVAKDAILQYTALNRLYDGATLGLIGLSNSTSAITAYGSVKVGMG